MVAAALHIYPSLDGYGVFRRSELKIRQAPRESSSTTSARFSPTLCLANWSPRTLLSPQCVPRSFSSSSSSRCSRVQVSGRTGERASDGPCREAGQRGREASAATPRVRVRALDLGIWRVVRCWDWDRSSLQFSELGPAFPGFFTPGKLWWNYTAVWK